MSEKERKPRRPRRELSTKEVGTVTKRVSEGATYSVIAKEIDASAFGTDSWQPLYDAVRRTAIETLGGQDAAIAAKKAGREAAKAAPVPA